MFRPEELTGQFQDIRQVQSEKLGIPVSWARLVTHVGKLDQFYADNQVWNPGVLPCSALPTLGPRLFDYGDTLRQTIHSLTGNNSVEAVSLRGSYLQYGIKAHVLLYEAEVSDNNSYQFVTYLSKDAEGTQLGNETIRDYQNLRFLSVEFEKRLKSEEKEKYGVVKPIAVGKVQYRGREHPFFTMPLIQMGELNMDFVGVGDAMFPRVILPFFRYASEYTREMSQVVQRQIDGTLEVGKALVEGRDTEDMFNCPQSSRFTKQEEDLLRANALVYLISGRRFPNEHVIGAGDWMGEIGDEGLKLMLITVRGGFSNRISTQEFYIRLTNQCEYSLSRHNFPFYPFSSLKWCKFEDILGQAETLLV